MAEIKIENKKESKTKSGLTALKKEELINIILRKDDVEKGLRKDAEGMTLQINALTEELEQNTNNINGLEDQVSMLSAENFILKNKIHKNNIAFNILFVIAILAMFGIMGLLYYYNK